MQPVMQSSYYQVKDFPFSQSLQKTSDIRSIYLGLQRAQLNIVEKCEQVEKPWSQEYISQEPSMNSSQYSYNQNQSEVMQNYGFNGTCDIDNDSILPMSYSQQQIYQRNSKLEQLKEEDEDIFFEGIAYQENQSTGFDDLGIQHESSYVPENYNGAQLPQNDQENYYSSYSQLINSQNQIEREETVCQELENYEQQYNEMNYGYFPENIKNEEELIQQQQQILPIISHTKNSSFHNNGNGNERLNTSHVPINMMNMLVKFLIHIYKFKYLCKVNPRLPKKREQKKKIDSCPCQRCQELDIILLQRSSKFKNINTFKSLVEKSSRIRVLTEHFLLEHASQSVLQKNYKSSNNKLALYYTLNSFFQGTRNPSKFYKLI